MTLHINQIVVCKDNSARPQNTEWRAGSQPVKGERYRIREIGKTAWMEPGVKVHGLQLDFVWCGFLHEDQFYRECRFAPINEDNDISQLTAMLGPKEKVRA